ncbi:ribonuclease H [Trifolium pratense]|uniref:Ribonuclease H n=1 Tax=Trifolium pratense TaxID=57577 RepID=A0A2K3LMF8_TRIPR|nr:ribonuclease H [Trifolium pratense]
MGFAEGWMKWIRACIFNSSMSVLVNGSPTEDFKVCKGLRQGDPLSPFLFLIAAEGLIGMINRAVEIGKFQGYKVNDSIQFQILQFADDTILMGEGSWNNLWTIKSVLRGFELVSGLKINFVKRIPVGANPRRRETWRPIVDAMTKRLSSWSAVDNFLMVGTSFGHKDSIWWRDVVSVGKSIMAGWFRSNISCVVGNGNDISFWNAKWCGNNSFGELFPNLFAKEMRQNSLIADKMIINMEGSSWR